RQAGAERGGAADRRLHALLQRGADDHVVHLGRVDTGALDRGADRMRREGGGGGCVERALIGPADGRTGGGDDDGFAACHYGIPLMDHMNMYPVQSSSKAGFPSLSI